jgi:hypothetical protein
MQIKAIKSGIRSDRAVKQVKVDCSTLPTPNYLDARSEIDTRADMTCAGCNCSPIYYTGQHCNIKGFHDDLAILPKVPIATVATAWSDPNTGEGYILIYNEVLFFGNDLDHTLVNPTQLWHNNIPVYDRALPHSSPPFFVFYITC